MKREMTQRELNHVIQLIFVIVIAVIIILILSIIFVMLRRARRDKEAALWATVARPVITFYNFLYCEIKLILFEIIS